jgi:hypothetical protein
MPKPLSYWELLPLQDGQKYPILRFTSAPDNNSESGVPTCGVPGQPSPAFSAETLRKMGCDIDLPSEANPEPGLYYGWVRARFNIAAREGEEVYEAVCEWEYRLCSTHIQGEPL